MDKYLQILTLAEELFVVSIFVNFQLVFWLIRFLWTDLFLLSFLFRR